MHRAPCPAPADVHPCNMQHTARRIDHSVLLDEPDPEPDAAFAASRFSLGCVTAPAACTPSPARTRARAHVRACVRAFVRACVCVSVRARACVRECVYGVLRARCTSCMRVCARPRVCCAQIGSDACGRPASYCPDHTVIAFRRGLERRMRRWPAVALHRRRCAGRSALGRNGLGRCRYEHADRQRPTVRIAAQRSAAHRSDPA